MDASKPSAPRSGGRAKYASWESTTYQEYRKFVEKDGAFERRFQKIDIDEPNQEETYKILLGLKKNFEEHHCVKYSNKVLRMAVSLSSQYINERKNPDKTIDIIDEAGAAVPIALKKQKMQHLHQGYRNHSGKICQNPQNFRSRQ